MVLFLDIVQQYNVLLSKPCLIWHHFLATPCAANFCFLTLLVISCSAVTLHRYSNLAHSWHSVTKCSWQGMGRRQRQAYEVSLDCCTLSEKRQQEGKQASSIRSTKKQLQQWKEVQSIAVAVCCYRPHVGSNLKKKVGRRHVFHGDHYHFQVCGKDEESAIVAHTTPNTCTMKKWLCLEAAQVLTG